MFCFVETLSINTHPGESRLWLDHATSPRQRCRASDEEDTRVDPTRILSNQEVRLPSGLLFHGPLVRSQEIADGMAEVCEEGITVDEKDPVLKAYSYHRYLST